MIYHNMIGDHNERKRFLHVAISGFVYELDDLCT